MTALTDEATALVGLRSKPTQLGGVTLCAQALAPPGFFCAPQRQIGCWTLRSLRSSCRIASDLVTSGHVFRQPAVEAFIPFGRLSPLTVD